MKIHTMKDDTSITTNVKEALAEDVRVGALDINVITDHGVVTLRGKMDTESQRRASEEIASQVPGVQGVENELELREIGYGAGSDEMAELEEEEEIWVRP